jgi:hypothetical protein
MPFVLNYWPANSIGWPLVSRTALDYNPPNSVATSNFITYEQRVLIDSYLLNNNNFQYTNIPSLNGLRSGSTF